jgi:hypothetical protein
VTYQRPPSSFHFDHRPKKRTRRQQSQPNTPPAIHVHLNNLDLVPAASSSASPSIRIRSPLTGSSRAANSSVTDVDTLKAVNVSPKADNKENWKF